jgi:hypothetical protein
VFFAKSAESLENKRVDILVSAKKRKRARKSVKRKNLNTAASDERRVPKWEEYPHTPGVFVRVANKGVAGYGTWKSVRKIEYGTATESRRH